MQIENGNTKRLARNTAFMYIRMFVLMVILFYSSRILLQRLGENDFGIYNLVGSVVAMFESLRTLFASSTQRFLNYEMGKNNQERLQRVFNTSLVINILIAVIFVIIVEPVGLWFLNEKANILPDRMSAAISVFHLSLATAVLLIVSTPFDATVIAHEKMDFFAIISIIEGCMKLAIALMLAFNFTDKLITYGLMMFVSSLIIRICYVVYCRRNFAECKIHFTKDKQLFKEMTTFAGWQFLGSSAWTIAQNGVNMVLNMFGGTIVNAARGVAYQVSNTLTMFLNNVIIAVNPYITKSYAEGNKTKMFDMIFFSSKVLFLIQSLITIPFLFLSKEILTIWLKDVPQYSVLFMQLVIIHSLIRSLHNPLDTLFKSYGKMKYYQLTESVLLLCPLVCSYFALKSGYAFAWVFIFMIVFELLNFSAMTFLATRLTDLKIKDFTKQVLFPCFVLFIIMFCVCMSKFYFGKFQDTLSSFVVCVLTDLVLAIVMLFMFFTEKEKQALIGLISKKIRR